jgi:hypothetical protein
VEEVQNHYSADVSQFHGNAYSGRFKPIITGELTSNRPVMLFMDKENVNEIGHAVVIDGYDIRGSKFMVHLNMGWGGEENGWYNFNEPILDYDGLISNRKIITIKPR